MQSLDLVPDVFEETQTLFETKDRRLIDLANSHLRHVREVPGIYETLAPSIPSVQYGSLPSIPTGQHNCGLDSPRQCPSSLVVSFLLGIVILVSFCVFGLFLG